MNTTVQSNYPDELRAAVAGMVATMIPATFISRTVEDSGGLAFGLAVGQGTNDNGCVLFDGTGTVVGISVRERSLDANEGNKFGQYVSARIMTHGAIYVEANEAVAAGDPVYVTDSNGTLGKSSGGGKTQIVGARWDTSAESGDIAQVRLT